MKVFKVEIVISGINDNPEVRAERIVSDDWQEVHELLSKICRDTGMVIKRMSIAETGDVPFDHKTVQQAEYCMTFTQPTKP